MRRQFGVIAVGLVFGAACASTKPSPPISANKQTPPPQSTAKTDALVVQALQAYNGKNAAGALKLMQQASKRSSSPAIHLLDLHLCMQVSGCDVAKSSAAVSKLAPNNIFSHWHKLSAAGDKAGPMLDEIAKYNEAKLYWTELQVRLSQVQIDAGVSPQEALTQTVGWLASLHVPEFSQVMKACPSAPDACRKVATTLRGGDALVVESIGVGLGKQLGEPADTEEWVKFSQRCAKRMTKAVQRNVADYLALATKSDSERNLCKALPTAN